MPPLCAEARQVQFSRTSSLPQAPSFPWVCAQGHRANQGCAGDITPWALLACPRWPRCSLRSPHLRPCSLRWAPVLPPCTYPGPSCYTSQPCWRPASTGHHAPAAVARGSVSPAGSARQPLQCCPVSWAGAPDPRGRRVLCGRLQAPVLWGHRKPTALPAPGCRLLAGQSPDVSGPHHPAICFPFSEPLVSTAAVTSPVC